MKLSFSTLGCPGWAWKDIFSAAKDLKMDGIEIRGVGDTINAPDIDIFSPGRMEETKRQLAQAGLEIPVLTSGACLGLPSVADRELAEAVAYVDLAARLGAPYVRVMITPEPQPGEGDLALCAAQYGKLCDYAAEKGVSPLLETNGVLAESAAMKQLMEQAGRQNAGVLWDLNHTVRFFGEKPSDTIAALQPWIRHVHLKDSAVEDGKVVYRMMGYGDLPVYDAVAALKAAGYEGYLSLEWVKRWNPELQEPGIVFAHFENYMRFLLNQL